jgi:hypothetical protein
MKVKINYLLIVCLAGVLIVGVSCGKKSEPEQTETATEQSESAKPKILTDDEHGFKLEIPDTWTVNTEDNPNLTGKYDLDLIKAYQIKDPEKKYELRVYVLSNPEKKSINDFLTVKKELKKSVVEYVIPRTVHEDASVPYVEVGYSYDPPQWGLIKAEIESMHALAPDKFVYMQLSVAKSVGEYVDFAKKLTAGFSAASGM